MRTIKEIFDDGLTKASGIVFVLIVLLVVFNSISNLTLAHPLFGVLLYTLVPILFVVGGIIFVLAILKSQG